MSTRPTLRTFLCTAALCSTVATAAFAQMDDAPAKPAQGAMDHARGAAGAAGAMQGDMQLAQALQKIKGDPTTAGDKLFVLDNAGGNMFEAAFSKLVASKATDPKLKELANMIEKDHSQANDKLKTIAQKMGVDLPTALPSEKQGKLEIMSALPPEELGKMYLMLQRSLHAKDVTMFADHEKAAKDSDLKAYIGEVLPKLKEHGAHINMVAKDMGAAASDTPADSLKS